MRTSTKALSIGLLAGSSIFWTNAARAIPVCPPGTHVENSDPTQPGGDCVPDAVLDGGPVALPPSSRSPSKAPSATTETAPAAKKGCGACAVGASVSATKSEASLAVCAALALVVAASSRRRRIRRER